MYLCGSFLYRSILPQIVFVVDSIIINFYGPFFGLIFAFYFKPTLEVRFSFLSHAISTTQKPTYSKITFFCLGKENFGYLEEGVDIWLSVAFFGSLRENDRKCPEIRRSTGIVGDSLPSKSFWRVTSNQLVGDT
jgi:hypothetical protein